MQSNSKHILIAFWILQNTYLAKHFQMLDSTHKENFFTHYEIVYVTIGNPAFCLAFYLASLHFRGELQHFGHVGEQKIKRWPTRTREIADIKLQNKLFVIQRSHDYQHVSLKFPADIY